MVVDDEPLAVELLSDYIHKCSFLDLVYRSTNPLEALSFISHSQVDLIFLDVQMKELSGLQFMKLLNGKPSVVLVTAYPDYALQGYEMNVIDYLLKPILFERFLQATQKALHILGPAVNAADRDTSNEVFEDAIFVKSNYKIIKIWLKDILFIEGQKEYVAIHTPKTKILSLQKMAKVGGLLPAKQFIRVHRSYIIAINKIDTIEQNRIFIADHVIPIGETYRSFFYDMLAKKNLM